MISISDTKIEQSASWKNFSFIIRILYFPIGLVAAFILIIQALLVCITIIGIPVGGGAF